MTSTWRFAVAVSVVVLGAACATSVSPATGGGTTGGSGDGGGASTDGASSYGDDDSGISIAPDGGATHPKDGGTTPLTDGGTTPVDSGTTTTPPSYCTGTDSAYKDHHYRDYAYDDWCDDDVFYQDSEIDCKTNSDCDGQFVDGNGDPIPSCCYNPSKTGLCYSDTGGKPQCVPQ